jgi:histidine triad (HIT) family protein
VASLFTRIIDREIPGVFVHEDDLCVAFLDVQPMTEGHVLVVPRQEVGHWIDLDDELSAHLFAVAKRIGQAQMEAFDCERIGLLVQGYEVPHVHVHVWPTNSLADFDGKRRADFTDAEVLEQAAAKLRPLL